MSTAFERNFLTQWIYFGFFVDVVLSLKYTLQYHIYGMLSKYDSRRGASDSVTDTSVLSNPADAQNVSCLGLCGRDICPKSSA